LAAAGKDGLAAIMAVTHTGMDGEDFTKTVLEWTKDCGSTRAFIELYTELVYQPMLDYWLSAR